MNSLSAAVVNHIPHGGVAQLGERLVRNEEVMGSNPTVSTKENHGNRIAVVF